MYLWFANVIYNTSLYDLDKTYEAMKSTDYAQLQMIL